MTRTLACRIWIGFAVVLGMKCLLQPEEHSLFPCFSASSFNWWKGWSLYDRIVMPHDYRYSPTFAVCFSIFAYLPKSLGAFLWGELNLWALWVALQGLVRRVLPVQWTDRQIGWFLTLSLLGTARSIWPGQCNLLILAMAIGALILIQDQRWWWAGLMLVAPVFIKIWPIVMLLLLLMIHPRKLLMPIILWTGVLASIPFLTQTYFYARSEYHEWYLAITGPIAERTTSYDAWGVWETLAGPVSPRGYGLLQIITLCILFATVLHKRITGVSIRSQQTFILWGWTSWQVVFGPAVERMTLGLVSPLAGSVVLESWSRPISRIPAVIGFVLTQIAIDVNFERGDWKSPYWLLLHPAGMLLLWIGFLLRGPTEDAFEFDQS